MGEDSRATSQAGSAGKWLAALVVVGALGGGGWYLSQPRGHRDQAPARGSQREPEPTPAPIAAPITPEPAPEPAVAVAPEVQPDPVPEAPAPETAEPEPPTMPPGPTPRVIAAPEPPAAEELDTLSRTDILNGVNALKGAFKSCYQRLQVSGLVKIRFTIAPSGHVTSVSASGDLGPTPTGACVAKAFQKAHFRAFSGDPVTVSFPVQLR